MTPLSSRYLVIDRLAVEIHPDRRALGEAAARGAAAVLRDILSTQGTARVIFACAPSQNEFLAALVDPAACGVRLDWSRIAVFHMDDYVGLSGDDPRSFRSYLREHLLSRVPVGRFYPLRAEGRDLAVVCSDYSHSLTEKPIDLICMGVGENGHIAFNDPGAPFAESARVKIVELDAACRQQQVNDGCFPSLAEVPRQALSLTVPVFREAKHLSIQVPGPRKASAVRAMLQGPIQTACPAAILRLHPSASLFLDADSAAALTLPV